MSDPDFLYRVVDDRSRDQFDAETGFTAADTRTAFDPYNDPQPAKAMIELHSDWGNRIHTPLISTTESECHAWKLACGRDQWGHTNVHVAIIDRELLERQVNVYRMMTIVDATNAKIAPKARSRWEHVCVHRIPMDTILRFYTIMEFQKYLSIDDDDALDDWDDYEDEKQSSSPGSISEGEEQWLFFDDEESQPSEGEEERRPLENEESGSQCLSSNSDEENESQPESAPKDGKEERRR